MNIIDTIITLRCNEGFFKNKRKIGYFRNVIICLSLLKFKVLTTEQVSLLLNLDFTSNQTRKCISALIKNKYLEKSDFLYEMQYATYAISSIGLTWIVNEMDLLIKLLPVGLNRDELYVLYKKSRKDTASNHYICICQTIIAVICAALHPLNTEIICEKPIDVGTEHWRIRDIKMSGQIVPDAFLYLGQLPVFIEADTTSVRFNAPKGPNEKLTKYIMMAEKGNSSNNHNIIHVIFSVQKGWPYQTNTKSFTSQELKILSNPSKQNDVIVVARLIAALLYKGDLGNITILQLWMDIKKNAAYFDKSLLNSSLIDNISVILNCLCSHDFKNEHVDHIRPCILTLTKQIKSDAQCCKRNFDTDVSHKRLLDIYNSVTFNQYTQMAMLQGISISCCPGATLHDSLPFLFPQYLIPNELMENLFKTTGLISEDEHISTILTSYKIDFSSDNPSENNSIICSNAYQVERKDKTPIVICIENISIDIGGFLRSQQFIQHYYSMDNTLFLLLFIDNSLVMANGEILSVDLSPLYDSNITKHYLHISYAKIAKSISTSNKNVNNKQPLSNV